MNMHKSSGHWRLGLTLALVTTLLWGILPIALKRLLDSMDPYTITWYRFLVAAVVQFFFIARKNDFPSKETLRGLTPFLLILAIFSLCGNYILYIIGLNYLSPSTATVLIQLAPVFLLLGGLFVFKEHFNIRQWIGFAILIFGLMLFFNNRLDELISSFGDYTTGVILIVAAAITWAVYALSQKQLLSSLSSELILFFIFFSGVLLFLPFARLSTLSYLTRFELLLLGFCAINTMIAYSCFAKALDHWEASRVSAVLSTTPLITMGGMACCAIFFPGFINPEQHNLLSIAGACLVVCGSFLCALVRHKDLE